MIFIGKPGGSQSGWRLLYFLRVEEKSLLMRAHEHEMILCLIDALTLFFLLTFGAVKASSLIDS